MNWFLQDFARPDATHACASDSPRAQVGRKSAHVRVRKRRLS